MQTDVFEKILTSSTPTQEIDLVADGLAGVLGKAASVVGLSELEVQLEAKSRAAGQCEPSDFIANLPELGLFFRTSCDTLGQIGLMVLDTMLVNSIGNVLSGDLKGGLPDQARAPTDIDVALCRPFCNALLLEFSKVLLELRGHKQTDVYNVSQLEIEPSPHLFPENPYLKISLELEFIGGESAGKIALLMPSENTEFAKTAIPATGECATAWKKSFVGAVTSAPASFDVVLHRERLPVGEILQLKAGDVLEFPARALESLSLEIRKDEHHQTLMRARLGEYQEMRAAKITQIGTLKPSDMTVKSISKETLS